MYREQSKRKANYAVVSEGSDRCLDAFVSVGSRAGTSKMMRHSLPKLFIHLEHVDFVSVEYSLQRTVAYDFSPVCWVL